MIFTKFYASTSSKMDFRHEERLKLLFRHRERVQEVQVTLQLTWFVIIRRISEYISPQS